MKCSDTVADIKHELEEKEGIDASQQIYMYGGKQLEDDKSLLDYNIEADCILNMELIQSPGSIVYTISYAVPHIILTCDAHIDIQMPYRQCANYRAWGRGEGLMLTTGARGTCS